jgi:hypothetical protein
MPAVMPGDVRETRYGNVQGGSLVAAMVKTGSGVTDSKVARGGGQNRTETAIMMIRVGISE